MKSVMGRNRTTPADVYTANDETDAVIDNYTAKSPTVRNGMTDRYLSNSKAQKVSVRSAARRISVEEMNFSGEDSPTAGEQEYTGGEFQLSRVNTWALMGAIVRESMTSTFVAVFMGVSFFSFDVILHKAVFQDGSDANTVWIGMDLEGWRNVGTFMPEVVFAIVGIALSIVSLILQLSATRYSPFVVELFFRDKVSSFTLHFFVGTAVFCVWINCLLGWTELGFLPRFSCLAMIIAVSAASLTIIPFFKYVFAFISPKTQIDIMVSEALSAALEPKKGTIINRQTKVLDSVQHLSEYALSAVHQKDAAIAFHSVSNMGLIVLEVMRHKGSSALTKDLFAAFRETDETLSMPAFENVNSKSREEVYANWLLWMVLFELNSLFTEANKTLQDACQQITSAVLAIGVEGVTQHDLHTIRLVMKFFNTFMRTGVNGGNIKLCCRVLNHYRKLVEAMMRSQHLGEEVVQGVQYMTYYAHIAYVKQVSWPRAARPFPRRPLFLIYEAERPAGKWPHRPRPAAGLLHRGDRGLRHLDDLRDRAPAPLSGPSRGVQAALAFSTVESGLCGVLVWGRRALNRPKRRSPARAGDYEAAVVSLLLEVDEVPDDKAQVSLEQFIAV
jgi:hypothetical protein